MSWGQYSEWLAFFSLEPWGSQRRDLRAGVIASSIYNANPFRKKGSKAVNPTDFFPLDNERQTRRKPMTTKSFRQGIKGMAKAYGSSGALKDDRPR